MGLVKLEANKLKELINDFQNTKQYKWFMWGEDYYNSDNTLITSRKKQYYDETCNRLYQEHPYKANHKLPSGYLKKIVDQKVQYLLGNGVTVSGDDERAEETYKEIFIDTLNELLSDVGTTASKKSKGWLKVVIEDGIIQFKEIQPEQIISFKDGFGNLIKLIRFFESIDENFNEITKVEIWDSESVQTFTIKDGSAMPDGEPTPHILNVSMNEQGEIIASEGNSFGRIPFVELNNNKAMTSDLKPIKPYIDIYDIINSDFANNIDDMQDAFFVIKNYGGENLPEFMEQLKRLKAVPVGEGGEIDTKQLEIPVEARETFLDRTDKSIFKFGMGVDTNNLQGSSITNVVIKAMFADLDLKADQFEIQIRNMLKDMTWFINWWLINIRSEQEITPKFTFNRSLIVNEVELLNANKEQVGVISDTTRLRNNPWVEDVEQEKEQIAEETEESLASLDNNMGFNE